MRDGIPSQCNFITTDGTRCLYRHGHPGICSFVSSLATTKKAHDDLVAFLEEQQRLSETPMNTYQFGALGKNTAIFEPVVFTRTVKSNGQPNIVIGSDTRIDSFVKIEGGEGVTIGDHVHIASFAHINIGGGTTVIEDGAAVASGAKIVSGGNAVEGISCSAAAVLTEQVLHRRTTTVKKNACLFSGVILTAGVTIGEGARIAAGAVVTKDVPAGEIWAGVPADKIGTVDEVRARRR